MEINIENRDKTIVMLKNGQCPICEDDKVYTNPLMHINKKHKISRNEVKDALVLKLEDSFCSEEYRQRMSKRAKDSKTHIIARQFQGKNKKRKKRTIFIKYNMVNNEVVKEAQREIQEVFDYHNLGNLGLKELVVL